MLRRVGCSEAPLGQVAQAIERPVHADVFLAGFAHRDDWLNIACIHVFPNTVSVITPICEQCPGIWQVVSHHQIETAIVGCLARRELCPHGQPMRFDEEVDLGRKATF